MAEVYLLGGAVTYSRVSAQMDIDLLAGGWCFALAAVVAMLAEGTLDRRQVWRAIYPDCATVPRDPSLACEVCDLVVSRECEDGPCPRCGHRLRVRKPQALRGTVAMTAAAFFLYAPAYILPMTRTVRPDGLTERTVLDGVGELFQEGFWYLGIIIFIVSVAIPFMKLAGLVWLTLRVKFPRRRGLVLRTKVHRIIHEINRWSFVDPFIVALTAPMMAYPGVADVNAGPGALPFALVVALTMAASQIFDTRLMWDEAERRAG